MRQARRGRLPRVHEAWQLWTDDEAERRRFVDLAAVRRLPAEPAGPKNRLRRVWRIEAGGRRYFLKQFDRTQWQNRLRFAATAPRARDDAERERLVTIALRDAGFAAPRPVAGGRAGAASFYLCAELAGTPCRDLLATGRAPAGLWRAVARHCGDLLARGFWLPDLSAEHVFAEPAGDGWRLGVLDLHNGRLGAPARAPANVLRRVLRRFSRSVRDLPVGFSPALRFAVRLLRAAGRRGDGLRAVLDTLPPFTTAGRYERSGKSADYAGRNPRRAARELELLQRVWPGRPGESVLDLPCGAGRLQPWLCGERGHELLQADGALAMLRQARTAGHAGARLVQADARAMPFASGAVDGVVLFRFLHHLDGDVRRVAIAEACRVARRFVTVSFFHPCSFHHLQRRLRRLAGAPPTRFAVTLRRLSAEFAAHGFQHTAHAAERPFARDLWLASFERIAGAAR